MTIDLAAVDRRMGLKLEDEAAFWFPPGSVAAAAACTGGTTCGWPRA